jgi:hypothetical protein
MLRSARECGALMDSAPGTTSHEPFFPLLTDTRTQARLEGLRETRARTRQLPTLTASASAGRHLGRRAARARHQDKAGRSQPPDSPGPSPGSRRAGAALNSGLNRPEAGTGVPTDAIRAGTTPAGSIPRSATSAPPNTSQLTTMPPDRRHDQLKQPVCQSGSSPSTSSVRARRPRQRE